MIKKTAPYKNIYIYSFPAGFFTTLALKGIIIIVELVEVVLLINHIYLKLILCTCVYIVGFKFSRASYVLSLLRPQIITDLELKVHIIVNIF